MRLGGLVHVAHRAAVVVVAASGYLQDQYYGTDCIDATFNATCRINATSKANLVMSIPLGLSAVLMPFVVWLIDQIGLRPFCCVLASAALVAAYLLLRFPVFAPHQVRLASQTPLWLAQKLMLTIPVQRG